MRSRPLGSLWEWDELRIVEAEAGRHLAGSDVSAQDLARAGKVWAKVPRLKLVELKAGEGWFGVTPGPGQPSCQLALASLLRSVRYIGWRVSNLSRRFSPGLALYVARRYGPRTLAWRNSWIKLIAPAAIAVERHMQRYPTSVDNMVAALAGRPQAIDLETFNSLSMESIARAMPAGEAADYFKAMR